mmetsp:Transcript_448/g.481  ORF Transcript_448/g.481 Transcript_448/m.481 type:complete len:103 (-) Transcript_448:948-1256(-)
MLARSKSSLAGANTDDVDSAADSVDGSDSSAADGAVAGFVDGSSAVVAVADGDSSEYPGAGSAGVFGATAAVVVDADDDNEMPGPRERWSFEVNSKPLSVSP